MPARDPFYKTRAAEIAANIIMAELDPFMGTVFTAVDSFCDGQVIATTRQGNNLLLEWDVVHQCIRTVRQDRDPNAVQVLEIAA